MHVPGEWYDATSEPSSSSRPASPAAYRLRVSAFSALLRPLAIGPAGTNAVGRCPKASAPATRPGTILSQTPSMRAPSKTSWLSAIAVDMAMTSRLNRLSSMPARPWVIPSHIAGTPPATRATAPIRRAVSLIACG